MRFSIKQAIRSISSAPFTALFLTLTFIGGFLVVYAATGFADAFLSDTACYMYGDSNDYYVWINTTSEFDTSNVVSGWDDLAADGCVFAGGYYCTVLGRDGYYINSVQSGFEQDFHIKLIDGRYFNQDEYDNAQQVCIIESNLADEFGYSVGDTCEIMSVECTIVGIVKTNAWLDRYIIPMSLARDIPYSEAYLMNYEMIIKNPDADFSLSALLSILTDSRYQISIEGFSSEIYQRTIISSLGKTSIVILIAILIFLYAFMNLISIAEFRRDAKAKEIGIRLAIGANLKQIYLETFIEYLILMLASILVLFIASPGVAFLIKGWISWSFGLVSVIGLPLLAVIFAAIISVIIIEPLHKSDRYSIIDLITERWMVK